MRRSLVTFAGLLRRTHAFETIKSRAAAFSTRAGQEAASSVRSPAALGLIGSLLGGGAVAYSFGSQDCTAHAEAPAATIEAAAEVEALNPYAAPTELKGQLPKEVILYQYEVCPFCCKVKAFLDYHKIPYRCVEVNPLTKAELKWSEYRKVPVIMIDGEQVNDSSAIISRLNAEIQQHQKQQQQPPAAAAASSRGGFLGGLFGGASKKEGAAGKSQSGAVEEKPGCCCTAKKREEEEKWRRWVDEWFVKVITVNIYRNAKESFQTFDYITQNGNFKFWEREAARIVGATMMWGLSGKLKKKYHVDGDVRDNLYAASDEWVGALGDHRFMGGDKPNMADLSMFGVIRAVTGTNTFHDLMHNTKIGPWYERMMGAVGESARLP